MTFADKLFNLFFWQTNFKMNILFCCIGVASFSLLFMRLVSLLAFHQVLSLNRLVCRRHKHYGICQNRYGIRHYRVDRLQVFQNWKAVMIYLQVLPIFWRFISLNHEIPHIHCYLTSYRAESNRLLSISEMFFTFYWALFKGDKKILRKIKLHLIFSNSDCILRLYPALLTALSHHNLLNSLCFFSYGTSSSWYVYFNVQAKKCFSGWK